MCLFDFIVSVLQLPGLGVAAAMCLQSYHCNTSIFLSNNNTWLFNPFFTNSVTVCLAARSAAGKHCHMQAGHMLTIMQVSDSQG